MAYADDLLVQARLLSSADAKGRPRQANLRRAVSGAYYALFHEVVEKTVRVVLSREQAAGTVGARLSRVVEHRAVLASAKWFATSGALPSSIRLARGGRPEGAIDPQLRAVCDAIVVLQEERHNADYDLWTTLNRVETERRIHRADIAVRNLRTLPADGDVLLFLLGCLLGDRFRKTE